MQRSFRVVVVDPVAARALRDAGLEAILVPAGLTADQLAETVLCEDAGAVVLPGDGPSPPAADLGAALAERGLAGVGVHGDAASLLSALLTGGQ